MTLSDQASNRFFIMFDEISYSTAVTFTFSYDVLSWSGSCRVGYGYFDTNSGINHTEGSVVNATSTGIRTRSVTIATSTVATWEQIGFALTMTNSTASDCDVQFLSLTDNFGNEFFNDITPGGGGTTVYVPVNIEASTTTCITTASSTLCTNEFATSSDLISEEISEISFSLSALLLTVLALLTFLFVWFMVTIFYRTKYGDY